MHLCIWQTIMASFNTQAPEVSLAEVERLKWLDVAQEKWGKMTELEKQALTKETRLTDTRRDVVGREVRTESVKRSVPLLHLKFLFIKYITKD